jgi:hypothetical protein
MSWSGGNYGTSIFLRYLLAVVHRSQLSSTQIAQSNGGTSLLHPHTLFILSGASPHSLQEGQAPNSITTQRTAVAAAARHPTSSSPTASQATAAAAAARLLPQSSMSPVTMALAVQQHTVQRHPMGQPRRTAVPALADRSLILGPPLPLAVVA